MNLNLRNGVSSEKNGLSRIVAAGGSVDRTLSPWARRMTHESLLRLSLGRRLDPDSGPS